MKVLKEYDARQRVAALLAPYSAAELAKATRVTVDAAKFWKDAQRCPNSANLINLARAFPAVAVWVRAEINNR